MQHVAIIDYGMGNLHSVASALELVAPDQKISITSDAEVIAQADRVIFPGVGAIRDCMHEINRLHIDQVVKQAIQQKPVLGICMGMQALMQRSEENGGTDCLSIFPGEVKFFGQPLIEEGQTLKVPHMGWNQVHQTRDHPLWQNIPQDSRFYFVHSYCIECTDPDTIAASCHYGRTFHAALCKANLFAVQFHPEKSHTAGLTLLKNFLNWNGSL